MTIGPGYEMAAGSWTRARASTADRDRAIEVLKAAFAEGRLTREEFGQRVGQVYVSRTFAELIALTADLPVSPSWRLPRHPATPAPPRTNRLAVAALVCATAEPLSAGSTAVPAIILGHMARRQVRRTGERGTTIATTALVLGWLAVLIVAVAVIIAA